MPCKIDDCFRNLSLLGFYVNHREGIELTEVEHMFPSTQRTEALLPDGGKTSGRHLQLFAVIESIRFDARSTETRFLRSVNHEKVTKCFHSA